MISSKMQIVLTSCPLVVIISYVIIGNIRDDFGIRTFLFAYLTLSVLGMIVVLMMLLGIGGQIIIERFSSRRREDIDSTFSQNRTT